jgi:hypothetical protein
MKKTSRTLLMAAAVSGLISGTALQQTHADPTNNAVAGTLAPVKNTPKVEGCSGQNDCKGIGGCKTDSHACKFQNPCKGKGGCEITEKDIAAWQKQQQAEAAKAAPTAPAKEPAKPSGP